MSPEPPTRLPRPLRQLGEEVHATVRAAEPRRSKRPRRRLIGLSLGGAAAIAVAIVVLVFSPNDSGPAIAESIVNRAPEAAARSRSVQFTSEISISLDSHQLQHYTEEGAIDFANRDYSTTLNLGTAGGAQLQRRLGDRLYVGHTRHGQPLTTARWESLPVAPEPAGRFASAPEASQFTAPPALLDGLATTRSPVSQYDHEKINGVPTTGWVLHTNLAAFLRASGAGRGRPTSYRNVGATIIVWLDKLHRPVRVRQEFASKSVSILTVLDFTAYGSPVTVEAPPKASVIPRRPVHASNPVLGSPSGAFEQLLIDSQPARH